MLQVCGYEAVKLFFGWKFQELVPILSIFAFMLIYALITATMGKKENLFYSKHYYVLLIITVLIYLILTPIVSVCWV
jgi:hypothetical protein